MTYNERFMIEALKEAQIAFDKDEVPIGAVIVKDNEVISRGHNIKETLNNSIMHAEIVAITNASSYLNNWRLIDCDMYVTIEPCPMCAGAIQQSRIRNLYFGEVDAKGGGVVSKLNVLDAALNHSVNYEYVFKSDEASEIMKKFFRNKRKKK